MTGANLSATLQGLLQVHLPSGYVLVAKSNALHLRKAGAWIHTSSFDDTRDDDDGEVVLQVTGALSYMQDAIILEERTPWPRPRSGSLSDIPTPNATCYGGVLKVWFGNIDAPDLPLPPINLHLNRTGNLGGRVN